LSKKIKERPRTQFCINATKIRENPITGKMEPAFSESQRQFRILAGFATILFMVKMKIFFLLNVSPQKFRILIDVF